MRALRGGEVDALLIDGPNGPRVYTLKTAAEPYRMLVEQMREGAMTVSPRGIVLYCNEAFADIVGVEPRFLVGSSILDLMSRSDLDYLMAPGGRAAKAAARSSACRCSISAVRCGRCGRCSRGRPWWSYASRCPRCC